MEAGKMSAAEDPNSFLNSAANTRITLLNENGQPLKKKIKLDRSTFSTPPSKPGSLSNGIKTGSVSSDEKPQDSGIKFASPKIKKEVKSPVKSPLKKPQLLDSDSEDDMPLSSRSKSSNDILSPTQKTLKTDQIEMKSPVKEHSSPVKNNSSPRKQAHASKKVTSEEKSKMKNNVKKSDSPKKLTENRDSNGMKSNDKLKKEEQTKLDKTSSVSMKKDKSDINKSKSSDVKKSDGKKILNGTEMKSETIKNDGVKKIKVESGVKKIKSESDVKKAKSDEKPKLSTSSSKSGVVGKVKSEKRSSDSEKTRLSSGSTKIIKKVKTEQNEMKSPVVDGLKTLKTSSDSDKSSGMSPKIKKKIKEERSSSSDVENKKKILSPKLSESITKLKSATEDSDDDDDEMPLAARVKVKKEATTPVKTSSKDRKRKKSDGDNDEDFKPKAKAKRKSVDGKSVKKEATKRKDVKKEDKDGKKEKETKKKPEEVVWKWWEEEKHPEGIKWMSLQHKGPYFPPKYEPLPDSVKFYYDGKHFKLSETSEEVAGFYAKMLDHDYTSKKIFNDNFFEDWRKEMTDEERKLIKTLSKCDFKEIHAYYVQKNEERKAMSKEEKQKIKEKNEGILQEYGFCTMDGHKERVGNFKIEPPGLFRGRGDHPKQGKLKKRVRARDVTINIGKDSEVPAPPEGQKWKAVTHDNKVTWLACWIENIQGSYKYVMLNPTSRIKGEKDWQKYETARKLKSCVTRIRAEYTNDWRAKEMRLRQRGVALYFIDKLALRAGHEKDEDTADTVGCCSLRVEHIKLHRQKDEKDYVVEFDFLGKDSIHYHNLVEVDKKVFKNLELFKQGKSDGDDLFDRLSTTSLNKYLSELMEGLSAKVFRTYNASMTLQDQLGKLEFATEDNVAAKVLGYNRANRAVAILCNHQRSAPKTFEQSMSNLQQKIEDKRKAIKDAKKEVKDLKSEVKSSKSAATEKKYERKKSALSRLQEQLFKLEVTQTDKEENKEIALGTSKLNYLDPRISVAWCLKNDVPLDKIYNKTQRQKFAWAIDMTEGDFEF